MHVFEYLKLISYCVVPFVIVLVLNVCIIVRLRQASPLQCADSVSLASSSNTTPSHPVINRSRRHFFAKTSMRSERPVSQSVVDETRDRLVTPSRREVMYVVCIYSEAHPDRGLDWATYTPDSAAGRQLRSFSRLPRGDVGGITAAGRRTLGFVSPWGDVSGGESHERTSTVASTPTDPDAVIHLVRLAGPLGAIRPSLSGRQLCQQQAPASCQDNLLSSGLRQPRHQLLTLPSSAALTQLRYRPWSPPSKNNIATVLYIIHVCVLFVVTQRDICVHWSVPRVSDHAINFYLYCITGSRFRQELCAMFGCRVATDGSSTRIARTNSKRQTAARRQNDEELELGNIANWRSRLSCYLLTLRLTLATLMTTLSG